MYISTFHIIRYATFLISLINCLTGYTAAAAEVDPVLPSKWSMSHFQLSLTKGGVASTETGEQQEIRRRAIDAILETYQRINHKGRYPRHFWEKGYKKEGLCVGPHWEYLPLDPQEASDGKGTIVWVLLPRIGTPSSECFSDLTTSEEMVLDCLSASTIACAKVCSVLAPKAGAKEAEFEGSFFADRDFLKGRAALAQQKEISVFLRLLSITGSDFFERYFQEGVSDIHPGDRVYIFGHPSYSERHPLGSSQGHHLFFVGFREDGFKSYIGFDPLFKDGPKTAQEIQTELAREYVGKNEWEEESRYREHDFKIAFQEIRKVPAHHAALRVKEIQSLDKFLKKDHKKA